MPLPKPDGDESERDFVSRCVSILTKKGEFDSQDQRVAVCYAQWGKTDAVDPEGEDVDRIDGVEQKHDVSRVDVGVLPPATRTDEGFLSAPSTRIARVGVQEYRRADGSVQRELRLPEYVFEEKSLASLNGKPVCRDHPRSGVDATNARDLARGTVTAPRQDGEFLSADLTIYDGETIRAVERDESEVSCGYKTRLVPIVGGVFNQPGSRFDGARADFLQTRIRHNHVAVLPRGRANEGIKDRPVRIRLDGEEQDVFRLDGDGNQVFSGESLIFSVSKGKQDSQMAMIKISGVEYDVPDEVAAYCHAMEAKLGGMAEDKADAVTKRDAALKRAAEQEARADEAEQRASALEQEKRDAIEAARGVDRFALLKQAELHVKRPMSELVRMDDADLRRTILSSKCPKLNLKDKDDAYIAARLDSELDLEKAKNSASDLRTPIRVRQDSDESPYLKAFADREAKRAEIRQGRK